MDIWAVSKEDKKLTTALSCGRHTLIADEPIEEGGQDLGPSPFELLASSLAACTAMTLRLYAAHKKISLGDFRVKVSVVRSCDPETKTAILSLDRELHFEDKTEAELSKYKEIAEKCPVHRALSGQIFIETHTICGERL